MYEGLETFSIRGNQFCDEDEDGLIEVPSCIDLEYGNQNCSQCRPWEFNIEGYCADSTDYNILQDFLDLNPESQSPQPLPAQTGIPKVASLCVNDDWWDEGRLVEITFQHKHLKSTIPENIGDLDSLKILRLTGNELTGGIPDNLMNLNNLKILKLNSNYIGCFEYGVGNDECLVHCNDTEECSGTIPENIGLLTNIDTLWLNDNNLSGEIPPSITNLTGLGHLYLQDNNLYGSIPYNIGDLNNLKYLSLDNNDFEGEIPQSIGNLTNLKRLYLYNNNLSGQIPESLCTINNLTMYLHNNQLCPGDEGYPECFPAEQVNVQNTSNCP